MLICVNTSQHKDILRDFHSICENIGSKPGPGIGTLPVFTLLLVLKFVTICRATESINRKRGHDMLFIEYPKCSTCQRAKKWLEQNEIPYTDRHIQEENPTYEELREWLDKSGLPLRKFFNTSGMLYNSMQLKDKLPGMSEEEQLRLLASDGMLVKRPIAVKGDTVLVGFTSDEWERLKG